LRVGGVGILRVDGQVHAHCAGVAGRG
jgi:hypothetical protein